MLLQSSSEEERIASSPTQPAAEIRVTPQELALAAAALEARREEESRRQENTLTLKEALHHLGLNATHDELLAEVESVRAAQVATLHKAAVKRRRNRLFISALAGLLLTVFLGMGYSILSLRRSLDQALHPYAELSVQTLAQIPEQRVVHADLDTLTRLAAGQISPDQAVVDTRADLEDAAHPGKFNKEWAVVKSGGVTYVKGWTTADYALMVRNNQWATLFSNRPAWLPPANLVTVQIPLYRFIPVSSLSSPSTEYDSKGAETKSGVTESCTIVDANEAIRQNMDHVFSVRLPHLKKDSFVDANNNLVYLNIEVKDSVVKLSGPVRSAALQKQAAALTEETLRRLHLNYRVDNHTVIQRPYQQEKESSTQ